MFCCIYVLVLAEEGCFVPSYGLGKLGTGSVVQICWLTKYFSCDQLTNGKPKSDKYSLMYYT